VTVQVTENTATVSWDPVEADIDRYILHYSSADGETREFLIGKEQKNTILTGLRPGVEYKVDVWAQKGARESKKASTKALTGNEKLSFVKVTPAMLSLWEVKLCSPSVACAEIDDMWKHRTVSLHNQLRALFFTFL
jgi:syndecan 4